MSQSTGRRPASRGGRGGRSSSRGGGGGGGRRSNQSRNNGRQRGGRSNQQQQQQQQQQGTPAEDRAGGLRDEDVLIAFMPFLKNNHPEAVRIHEEYQMGKNDQKAFLKAARDFLSRGNAKTSGSANGTNAESTPSPSAQPSTADNSPLQQGSNPSKNGGTLQQSMNQRSPQPAPPPASSLPVPTIPLPQHQPQQLSNPSSISAAMYNQSSYPTGPTTKPSASPVPSNNPFPSSNQMPPQSLFPSSPSTNPLPSSSIPINTLLPPNNNMTNPTGQSPPTHMLHQRQHHAHPTHQNNLASSPQDPMQHQQGHMAEQPQRNSSFDGLRMNSIERGLDALMDDESEPIRQQPAIWRAQDAAVNPAAAPNGMPPTSLGVVGPSGAANTATKPLPITPPRKNTNRDPTTTTTPDRGGPGGPWGYGTPVEASTLMNSPMAASAGTATNTPQNGEIAPKPKETAETTKPPPKKEIPPPKRLWTHPEDQPGKVLVKGTSGDDSSIVIPLAPREELHAQWGISLAYLRKYSAEKYGANASLETVLSKLTLGLFRRGCTENGMQASIVSKSVLGEYWKDAASESVRGKVPFYSPRTPGHVVFRLFWEDNPLYTLATGPAILVRVTEPDFDNSIRFILSNFKGKKSNPTSLSSLHSLATILETQITRPNDSAARAAWGCIQEARKVLEACSQEHERTSSKLEALEGSVEELKKQVEGEDHDGVETASADGHSGDGQLSEAALELKEKVRSLMSGRASCERKWRDSQLAFAGILRAVVLNPSMSILLRRDLIAKMRLEFELWCPLAEEFAIPNESSRMWFEPLRDLPQELTTDIFRNFSNARVNMQMRTLGFHPNTMQLEDVLFPRNPNTPGQRAMDPGAVKTFNSMSSAMGSLYQELFKDEDVVVRRREMIRKKTEECVQQSGVFPPGTQVVIFGSSANGFGSPKSDLDMCLQLPDGRKIDDEDIDGSSAMGKLAEYLESSGGMIDVDTSRLSARIPIIMYRCPSPLPTSGGDEENVYIECDISMHNPLAVLNTSLLRSYAEITPITRVLSSIIKRWAKARDINNPARHTLSSYGYIIMLLHFLTYHKRTGNGLVSPVAPPEGNPSHRHQSAQRPHPILPNIQWMDPAWPSQAPRGTPYREMLSLPRLIAKHPREEGKRVNTHFFKPSTPNDAALLQMTFAGQDLSLAILLVSFFRYYAYEFDYKRYVVSLNSTSARGIVEREVKAELDGWRNYSAALTIEDPFETFYDVAHVLRGGYYHRIRREFAVAYSKVADAAAGRQGAWNKGDLRSMTGEELVEWICEPIEKEREENPTATAP